MTRIAIGVDDEQNILANLSDGLHPDFAVVSTVVLFLQRWIQENARRVVEAKSSFAQVAPALGSSHSKSMARGAYASSVP